MACGWLCAPLTSVAVHLQVMLALQVLQIELIVSFPLGEYHPCRGHVGINVCLAETLPQDANLIWFNLTGTVSDMWVYLSVTGHGWLFCKFCFKYLLNLRCTYSNFITTFTSPALPNFSFHVSLHSSFVWRGFELSRLPSHWSHSLLSLSQSLSLFVLLKNTNTVSELKHNWQFASSFTAPPLSPSHNSPSLHPSLAPSLTPAVRRLHY